MSQCINYFAKNLTYPKGVVDWQSLWMIYQYRALSQPLHGFSIVHARLCMNARDDLMTNYLIYFSCPVSSPNNTCQRRYDPDHKLNSGRDSNVCLSKWICTDIRAFAKSMLTQWAINRDRTHLCWWVRVVTISESCCESPKRHMFTRLQIIYSKHGWCTCYQWLFILSK